ncbi:hypothetical protein [Methylobacterium nodulans]|uniref:Uncharacterized protein n=1 Tax=Methylobacterium nodulans (strain LMG 21967 / CNCM I-2342 / ORS 2060) TaxID=460265 RepID=B8IW89_METNO|nr:hypothetical protein [Methylobacterium nodulans]ACL62679.1 conserved hypothetical protein [Methylobacterium nodulans ORS 2060]
MRLTTLSLTVVAALTGPALAQPGATVGLPIGAGLAPKPAPAQKPVTAAPGGAIFPTAISPKYAHESAGKARQKTCLDQDNANKAAGGAGNGGLNWIQKGGGYYSECNKRLKG